MNIDVEYRRLSLDVKLVTGIIGIAATYWFFETGLGLVTTNQPNWQSIFLGANWFEILRRLVVLLFFVVLGSHAQFIVMQKEQVESALQSAREEESKIQKIALSLATELHLEVLLQRIMDTTKELLGADRGTLFLYDSKTDDLYSAIAHGLEGESIRIPRDAGIAGYCFTKKIPVLVRDAYQDERFIKDFDLKTGYQTESVLCAPIVNKQGRSIGVIEILNKNGGIFTTKDERRLAAFAAQVAVAIENAAIFEEMVNLKNYNESILNSMSNGVVTVDRDLNLAKTNSVARKMLKTREEEIVGRPVSECFDSWVGELAGRVMNEGRDETAGGAEMTLSGDQYHVNLVGVPLLDHHQDLIGAVLVIEDISREKTDENHPDPVYDQGSCGKNAGNRRNCAGRHHPGSHGSIYRYQRFHVPGRKYPSP